MSKPLVVRGMGHSYGETPVICGVNLELEPGEIVAVLGASGCGKTTLLRSVAGFVVPSQGEIVLAGRSVCSDGALKVDVEGRNVGLVFQDYALFPTLSVRRNVSYGCRDASRVESLLQLVGLADLADRLPAQLSGGQQQRVALARALAPKPHLLLLDEPFANVDAGRRAEVGDSLRSALAAEERAALLVTHDRTDALAMADRVLVLTPGDAGAVVGQLATPREVYMKPASVEVARLTGEISVLTSLGAAVMVRPEWVQVGSGDDATVLSSRFRGPDCLLELDLGGERLRASHPEPIGEGTRVGVTLTRSVPT